MALTVLQMVQQAEQELGLPMSSTVYSLGTDNTGQQMGALANRVLDEMRRMNRWTAQMVEFNLVVNASIGVTGDLPAESPFINNIVPSTTGITANNWVVAGPGIPVNARVIAVSTNQVQLNMENTNVVPVMGQSIQFAQDSYPLPTSVDWMNNRTWWDRTNRWELLGPDSPQLDQWHRSGIVATGPRRHFRIIGRGQNTTTPDAFRLWPPPFEVSTPLQFALEYLTNQAVNVTGSGVTFAQYFTNDTDVPLLDDQALIMGIKWMFWEAKGFGSYVTMQGRWVDYMKRLMARDGAAQTMPLVSKVNPIFVSPANVQDGFFPGPVGPNQGM